MNYKYVPTNVAYYLHEEGLYFLDDVDRERVNVIEPTPYKDEYKFLCWYKDLSGSVKFILKISF